MSAMGCPCGHFLEEECIRYVVARFGSFGAYYRAKVYRHQRAPEGRAA